MGSVLESTIEGTVKILRLNSGPMNVLGLDALIELRGHVEEATLDDGVRAIVLLGREDAFSAGLDAAVLGEGAQPSLHLAVEMLALLFEIYRGVTPVVCAVRGHAVAAGAMLLLVSDRRLGSRGDYKVGFSEVARGVALPEIPVLLARERLARRSFQNAVVLGHLYGPDDAVDAGYLDRLVSPVALEDEAVREGNKLAALPTESYEETLKTVRGELLSRMEFMLGEERIRLRAMLAPLGER